MNNHQQLRSELKSKLDRVHFHFHPPGTRELNCLRAPHMPDIIRHDAISRNPHHHRRKGISSTISQTRKLRLRKAKY